MWDWYQSSNDIAMSYLLLAVVVIGKHQPVGVDVETWSQQAGMLDLIEQFMSPGEQNQLKGLTTTQATACCLRAWTRKEAALKALGCGLSLDARRVEVGLSASPASWSANNIRPGHHVWPDQVVDVNAVNDHHNEQEAVQLPPIVKLEGLLHFNGVDYLKNFSYDARSYPDLGQSQKRHHFGHLTDVLQRMCIDSKVDDQLVKDG